MKPTISYLAGTVFLLMSCIGCGPKYGGTYLADVKLVSGSDPYLAMLGDGNQSETALTSIYIICRETSANNNDCYISKIATDDGSTLDVHISIMGDGPFVDKDGSTSSRFFCGPYPGKENIQICVRPFKKTK